MRSVHIVANFPKFKDENGDPIVSEVFEDRKLVGEQQIEEFCDQHKVPKDQVIIVSIDPLGIMPV